jgi:hypothetical protein
MHNGISKYTKSPSQYVIDCNVITLIKLNCSYVNVVAIFLKKQKNMNSLNEIDRIYIRHELRRTIPNA